MRKNEAPVLTARVQRQQKVQGGLYSRAVFRFTRPEIKAYLVAQFRIGLIIITNSERI